MSNDLNKTADYWRSDLPIDVRVKDLLSRMTVEEKARQLDMYMGSSLADKMQSETTIADDGNFDTAKARALLGDIGAGSIHDIYPRTPETINIIQTWLREHSRLGIPAIIIEEGLHGVSAPNHTIFPQSISLAATWNPENARKIGAAIAAEMRAHNIHLSLSPVLDLARDVRWGRTEETFGEDPFIVGRMGTAYVQGMQGDSLATDHNVVAEPKHFAGHGSSEAAINQGPVHMGEREFHTMLIAGFKAAFTEGKALGAMCAYHEKDGIPCAANHDLLTKLLRDEWGFEGIVISDLGAISQLETKHFVAEDATEAVCQAISAGVDMQFYDYPHDVFQGGIVKSVANGRLPMEVLDTAVGRVLSLKFRLGLFDNPFIDPALKSKVNMCQAHLDVALQTGREAICLLKNEDNLLPLRKDIGSIAVIGPNAAKACLGDYVRAGDRKIDSLLDGIKAIVSKDTQVSYVNGMGVGSASMQAIPAEWLKQSNGKLGLRGEYYAKPGFAGEPHLVRADSTIDFNWAVALAAEGMPPDHFSVRWEGYIVPDRTVEGLLGISCQDHMRCWVDNELVLDCWHGAESATINRPFEFEAGQKHAVRVEYQKRGGGSVVMLGWNEGFDEIEKAVEAAKSADVAIVALGDSDMTCGEGVDRATLDLPDQQLDLLKAIYATGTPVVLVLQNGRPFTITWEAKHIPAIVEAWYPGEVGAKAMAEVLFGDYNPAGRLPVTFPKSVGQLPMYYNHKPSLSGRYVEMDHEPLYRFGHGLSYTSFAYDNLVISPSEIKQDGSVTVSVDVRNTGTRAGDEVVQLYIRDILSSVTTPVKSLKGFSRIHLQPDETRTVSFELKPNDLMILDQSFNWVVEPGTFKVMVGGSSKTELEGTFEVG